MTRQLLYLHLIELKLSAFRCLRSLVSFVILLLRYHRGLGEHLALVDHDVERLIVLLDSFDVSRRFYFLVVFFFLSGRRILFVEYSLDVILKVLIFEIRYPFSLFTLIQCVFESLHFVRIAATHRTTRSRSLWIVMRVLLLLVSVGTAILNPLLLIKGAKNAIKLSFHLSS